MIFGEKYVEYGQIINGMRWLCCYGRENANKSLQAWLNPSGIAQFYNSMNNNT